MHPASKSIAKAGLPPKNFFPPTLSCFNKYDAPDNSEEEKNKFCASSVWEEAIMNAKNFARGMGIGMVVGSAIGMTVGAVSKKSGKQTSRKVSRAMKTVGDIMENIGSTLSM